MLHRGASEIDAEESELLRAQSPYTGGAFGGCGVLRRMILAQVAFGGAFKIAMAGQYRLPSS
jgi:hypothetical protein